VLIICSAILLFFSGCSNTEIKKQEGESVKSAVNAIDMKPWKVLVIIGDQWNDPYSYNIDRNRVSGTDFTDVVTMLKIWGVPFDILRLDQQRLQINRFLDGAVRPNYGCVIWMADPDNLEGYSANYQTLTRVVEEYGISLIALSDYIKTKEVADLTGVDYKGVAEMSLDQDNRFEITGDHYITNDEVGTFLPDAGQLDKSRWGRLSSASEIYKDKETGTKVSVIQSALKNGTKLLGSIGKYPQLVVKDVNDATKVIWIGGGKDWFRKYPVMRRIFRNALVYSIGYGIFNDNFENGLIFVMDDVGCSEHAWSMRWHCPTPDKETLIKYLIEPLEKYGKMMVQNVTPGYANPVTQMVEVPWTIKPFRDVFGNWQDYGSTKEGLDEGLKRGVFEIQTHRIWTHMNWDLDSPPGPWWTGAVDGEMAEGPWYTERADSRRGVPIPSNDLLFMYRTGIDAVKKAFGVTPLSAAASSFRVTVEEGDSERLRVAAIAGIGVSSNTGEYISHERSIEFTMMMPEVVVCHDLDLTVQTDDPADKSDADWYLLREMPAEDLLSSKIAGGRRINLRDKDEWINSRKDKKWMGFNEYCAYLHTGISIDGNNGPEIELYYDQHYCHYFRDNSSSWTIEFPDDLMDDHAISVTIDGVENKIISESGQTIEIPEGTGKHSLKLNFQPK